MEQGPLRISVAMPLYNGASFVNEQLDSLASQTRLPDEMIICDDCSTDGSAEIAENFAHDAPFRVRLHVNTSNLGVMQNFEKVVRLSTGDVIFFCDWDDVWMPDKLERMEGVFTRSPGTGVVECDGIITDEHLKPLGTEWRFHGFSTRKQKLVERGIFKGIRRAPLAGHGMAFRSRFKPVILPFPEHFLDPDTWVGTLIGCYSAVSLVKEPLVKYRRHGKQFTAGSLELTPRQKLRRAINLPRAVNAALKSATIYERVLRGAEGFVPRPGILSELAQWRDHCARRVNMSERRVTRLPLVLRELIGLRYHRYSGGFSSVAKDLFVR
jgi:glycosyltransferase involved in cell wall biosynthesis